MEPDTLLGRSVGGYQLDALIDAGAESRVYRAARLDLAAGMPDAEQGPHAEPRAFAVKVFEPPVGVSEEQRTALQGELVRQARTLARLRNPHIVPVLAFGVSDGIPYLVMPYLSGGTLADALAAHGQGLPWSEVVSYLAQIADALDYAHTQGVVHGDVKPSNILLDGQGGAYLTGFPLYPQDVAPASGPTAPAVLTQTGEALGTPFYMAPEAIKGEVVGPQADIYSLGITAYQMVTGQVPFQGETPLAVALQQLQADPAPPGLLRPGLPRAAEDAILRALQKSPGDRPATAADLARALGPVQGGMHDAGAGVDAPASVMGIPPQQQPAASYSQVPPPAASPLAPSTLAPGDMGGDVEDQRLRFTAYHPQLARAGAWQTLVVYPHLEHALAAVRADAAHFSPEMGGGPSEVGAVASREVATGAPLTFIPTCAGVTFQPERVTLPWTPPWQRAVFSFRPAEQLAGATVEGEVACFAGPALLAVLTVTLRCAESGPEVIAHTAVAKGSAESTTGVYQDVFLSYSNKDRDVVLACRDAYKGLGLQVKVDVDVLRAGERFDAALMRLIEDADVFQLFWSRHAASSAYVRREWEHALQCGRGEGFIRPVVWEQPPPAPPPELADLHFAYVPLPHRRKRWFGLFG